MTLHEWIDEQIAEYPACNRTDFMKILRHKAGVSMTTLGALDRGARLSRGDKAQAIVAATGGAVTLEDLL